MSTAANIQTRSHWIQRRSTNHYTNIWWLCW